MTAIIEKNSTLGILHTGLAFRLVAQIRVDNQARNLSGSTVVAQILSRDHAKAFSSEVALDSEATGAAWATGKVVVQLPAEQTATITAAEADLAIYETDAAGLKWGYFMPLRCVQGLPNE